MSHIRNNPADLHDPVPFGYSHTVSIPASSRLVVVSGQYASGPDGAVTSTSFPAQVQQVFANLRAALAAQDLELADVVQLRTYIVGLDVEKLGAFGEIVGGLWGGEPPANTMLGVGCLATPDMLVEVEALAATA